MPSGAGFSYVNQGFQVVFKPQLSRDFSMLRIFSNLKFDVNVVC